MHITCIILYPFISYCFSRLYLWLLPSLGTFKWFIGGAKHHCAVHVAGTPELLHHPLKWTAQWSNLDANCFLENIPETSVMDGAKDILVSFRTGHFEKGVLVLDSRKIAKHYLKRWFLFDLCVLWLSRFWPFDIIKHGKIISFYRWGYFLEMLMTPEGICIW